MSVLSYTYKSVKYSWPEKQKNVFVPSCDTDSGNVAYLGPNENIHMRRGTESAGLSLRQAMEKLKVEVEGVAKISNIISEKIVARDHSLK